MTPPWTPSRRSTGSGVGPFTQARLLLGLRVTRGRRSWRSRCYRWLGRFAR
jgi:hypothetical protein